MGGNSSYSYQIMFVFFVSLILLVEQDLDVVFQNFTLNATTRLLSTSNITS